MATTEPPFTGTFIADPAHSTLQFGVEHFGVSTFWATFDEVDARVLADESGVRLEGSVRAESLSIKDPPEFREAIVYGADFLDAHNHPEISFRSTDVRLGGDRSVTGDGEITIRGITKPVSATATYHEPVTDPYGNRRTAVTINSTIDRREWDLNWQAPLPDGGLALGYDVTLTIQLELIETQ